MTSQFADMMLLSNFFDVAVFSYWFQIHDNIITGSRVMTIFVHKGLTRNPEIGNSSV